MFQGSYTLSYSNNFNLHQIGGKISGITVLLCIHETQKITKLTQGR